MQQPQERPDRLLVTAIGRPDQDGQGRPAGVGRQAPLQAAIANFTSNTAANGLRIYFAS